MAVGIPTLTERLKRLSAGDDTAIALLEAMLARANAPGGNAVYTRVFERTARAEAKIADIRRQAGVPGGPLAGLPIAVKDCFDVTGEVTRSGSRLLSAEPPAGTDATVVRRLRAAGAVIVGHTNMTEFAYSGVGLNPHYGTPANPLAVERIPGGSSSGSAVAVAGAMAAAALGTDTGGSVRIPAAFCGLVGWKPTRDRVPRAGLFPLSTTLDSIGPIGVSVDCCARLDAVLSGDETPLALTPAALDGLRLRVPKHFVLDDMDATVAEAFARALRTLGDAGARVTETVFEPLDRLAASGMGGGFAAAESYHRHRQWLTTRAGEYDPRVRGGIERGADISAADYLDLQQLRMELMSAADRLMADCDALVMPTVPIVPPCVSALKDDIGYRRVNALVLRNPATANLLGLCAISLPCHRPDELPTGIMLVGRAGADRALLRVAAAVERVIGHREEMQ